MHHHYYYLLCRANGARRHALQGALAVVVVLEPAVAAARLEGEVGAALVAVRTATQNTHFALL